MSDDETGRAVDNVDARDAVKEIAPSGRTDGTPPPPDGPATDVLASVREESRIVLDHRIDLLYETDDKVASTVRTAMLVLSMVISVSSVGSVEAVASVPELPLVIGGVGIAGLFATVIYGVVAYTDAKRILGPGRAFRREPQSKPYSEREWLILLAVGYDEWLAEMKNINDSNERQLWRIQILLASSLFVLLAAIGLSLWPS